MSKDQTELMPPCRCPSYPLFPVTLGSNTFAPPCYGCPRQNQWNVNKSSLVPIRPSPLPIHECPFTFAATRDGHVPGPSFPSWNSRLQLAGKMLPGGYPVSLPQQSFLQAMLWFDEPDQLTIFFRLRSLSLYYFLIPVPDVLSSSFQIKICPVELAGAGVEGLFRWCLSDLWWANVTSAGKILLVWSANTFHFFFKAKINKAE